MVKIEDSDSIYDGYKVNPDNNQDGVSIDDINEGEGGKYPRLGRGHRIRTQTTTNYVPSWNNKSYPKWDPKGVNLAHIESIGTSCLDDNELGQGCNVGAGYKANQGVAKVKFAENSETPPRMSEELIEAHIVGVVMINHFNMKKGIYISGNRDNTAVIK